MAALNHGFIVSAIILAPQYIWALYKYFKAKKQRGNNV
jgi:hypothetical protein